MKFHNYFEGLFNKRKVSRQFIILFLTVFFIPLLFISIWFLYDSQKLLANHYKEQSDSDNLRIRSILFDITTNALNLSEYFASDTELLQLLNTTYDSESSAQAAINSYKNRETILRRDTSVSSIKVFSFNKSLNDNHDFYYLDSKYQNTDWFKKASTTHSGYWYVEQTVDDGGTASLSLVLYKKVMLVESHSYAILSLTISNNYLKNRIHNNTLNSMLCVNDSPVFYSSEKTYLGASLPINENYFPTYFIHSGLLQIGNQQTIGTVSTLLPYKTDDFLYIVTYSPNALPEIKNIQQSYIVTIGLLLVFLMLLFFVFSKYFSNRVVALKTSMWQASHGHYEMIEQFSGNDEFYEIFHDLKIMINEIKKKEALLYQNQLKKQQLETQQQQMEFKMLASQINPHFLYNALETIRMKAFTNGDREVATAIKLLGKSLRYVLDNTGTVSTSLAKEIEHIRTYICIQKLRFGARVNYEELIDQDIHLEDYKILPLMLQPIVENAISHGLESYDENEGKILLLIFKEDDCLCIEVSDNGIGMTKEQLCSLQEKIMKKNLSLTQSIGLYNINQRIRLCYGENYSLHISSQLGKGTTVRLTLPLFQLQTTTN